MLLLLGYDRRLRVIPEALELGVEGGCGNHSLCMYVISHGSGWLGWAEMERWRCMRNKPRGCRLSGDALCTVQDKRHGEN